MSEDIEFLRDYRSRLDVACESLAITLGDLGATDKRDDHELVEVAGKKLRTLFEMIKAAGLSEGILRAVMAE